MLFVINTIQKNLIIPFQSQPCFPPYLKTPVLTTDMFYSIPFSMKIPRFSNFLSIVILAFLNGIILYIFTIFFSLKENKTTTLGTLRTTT